MMKFGLLLFLLFILSMISSINTDDRYRRSIFQSESTLDKLRHKASNKYRNLKAKFSNNRSRYQSPSIAKSDTTQKRLVNQANTNNITHATVENIYSTSSIAEDYCRDYGPTSSVLLFAYRGSCYSLTNQLVAWSQADNLCQTHFHSNMNNKNQGGLASFDDEMEFDYIRSMIGDFNRSASEFGAYIGFNYRNQSWLWLNGRPVDFAETPPSVTAPNNLIFPYQQQKPCGKIELLRPNETTILFGLMQQECTKTERALCKIKLDHCFENDQCGIHGVCKNAEATFQCECTFLYDGIYCDQYSSEAIQVIAASLFIAFACLGICLCKRTEKSRTNRQKRQVHRRTAHGENYLDKTSSGGLFGNLFKKFTPQRPTECKKSAIPPPLPNPRPNISKRHRPKPIMDTFSMCVQTTFTMTLAGISLVYVCVQRATSIYTEHLDKSSKNHSTKSYLCQFIGSNNSNQNIIMLPLSIVLTIILVIIHHVSNPEKKKSFSFPVIVNPFQKSNRFYTTVVFAVISNQLITLLYEILFSSSLSSHHGILYDLVRRLGLIILYGTRYFPILLSLNIHSFLSTFSTSIFLTFDILLSVYSEANCVQTFISTSHLKNLADIGSARVHYLLFTCAPHYLALAHLTGRFYTLTFRNFVILCKGNSERWNSVTNATYHTTSIEYDDDWYYTKSLLMNKEKIASTGYYLYAQAISEEKKCSCLRKFIHLFYKPKAYFRYSLLVLFTYTVAILVLYYLTCLIIFSSTFTLRIVMNFTGNLLFKIMNLTNWNFSIKSFEHFSFEKEIYFASIFSFVLYIIQLLLGLKKYQADMLNYYRGKHQKKKFDLLSSSSILQRSFHYSGYQVGYLAYGFVLINYTMFCLCLLLKLLFIHPLFVKIVLKIIVPIGILFALKHVIVYCLTRYFFLRIIRSKRNPRQKTEHERKTQQDIYTERQDQAIYSDSIDSSIAMNDDDEDEESHLFTLENRHAYFLFVYFNFFFDCFLGVFSCVLRLVKSGIAVIVFMPRLDYSTLGRNLENADNGFSAYTSYIYVEAMHTHPILITFTQILYMDILEKRRRRQKHFLFLDEKQILEQNRRKSIRFRWFLLISLMNNFSLIPTRRHQRRMTMHNQSKKIHQRTSSSSSLSNGTVTIDMGQ